MQPIDQHAFIERVRQDISNESAVRGLFLAGSYGRGTADAFSDVDFVALAPESDHAEVAAAWRRLIESIAPVVFWNEINFGSSLLLNAVTEDWLRCDVVIMQPSSLRGRAQDTVKPLIDRDGIYASLPETLPPAQPDPKRVRHLINEFIRVLGLLPVAIGRREYVLGVTGTGLLRDLLTQLLLQEVTIPDKDGALHLSRLLPDDQMKMLADLPYPRPDEAQVIEANVALARAFFPRARRLAERIDLPWPTAFEEATRRNLERRLGIPSVGW